MTPSSNRPPKVNKASMPVSGSRKLGKFAIFLQGVRTASALIIQWYTIVIIIFGLSFTFVLLINAQYVNSAIAILITFLALKINCEVT